MAVKCIHHPNAYVPYIGICARCKSCKHKAWWRKIDSKIYKCCNCGIKSDDPTGDRWVLDGDKWTQEKDYLEEK
jgi:hypothetical protein